MNVKRCAVNQCANKYFCKSYCRLHFERWKAHGNPLHRKTMSYEHHGMTKTREYKSWESMRTRCYNKNSKRYKDYGGRGITICDEWRYSFMTFYRDMGDKPTPRHSIERIDNDGNYEPSNCKWATAKEQNNNQRPRVLTKR